MNEPSKLLGDLIVDAILYGDMREAPWPKEWQTNIVTKNEADCMLLDIAATIMKWTHGGPGGSASSNDKMIARYLRQPAREETLGPCELCWTWSWLPKPGGGEECGYCSLVSLSQRLQTELDATKRKENLSSTIEKKWSSQTAVGEINAMPG